MSTGWDAESYQVVRVFVYWREWSKKYSVFAGLGEGDSQSL